MAEGEKKPRPPRRRRTNRPVIVERKGERPRKQEEAPAEAGPAQAAPQPQQGQADRREAGRRDRRGRRPHPGKKGPPRRDGDRKKPAPIIRTVEVTVEKGKDFVIRKRTDFDEKTRKPVAVTYTLTREGLAEPAVLKRLSEAREAATKPLPEPAAPPPANEAEATEEAAAETPDAAAPDEPAAETGND